MLKAIFINILVSITVNMIFYCLYPIPAIATVDVLGITTSFIQEAVHKKSKDSEIKAFSQNLEKNLEKISHKKSVILLPKEAVLKGSSDYTALLQEMMLQEKRP